MLIIFLNNMVSNPVNLRWKADFGQKKWRRGSESDRFRRFCRPLPNRLATTPR